MPALFNSVLKPLAQGQTAAPPPLTDAQKALLEEANKLTSKNVTGGVTEDDIRANPNMNAQQLANKHVTDYWSNESEAFSRVNAAMNNGTAKLGQYPTGSTDEDGNPITQLGITAGGHPGYDTLFLKPTGTPNVYSFTTRNQVAGGNISGIIGANPETGKYAPITNAAIQTGYTPGSPGGWIKNTLNDIGPLGNIALAIATGGLSIPEQLAAQTAMNLAKGQDFGDALKGAGLAVGGSQLVQGITSVDPVSGMDLAADAVAGNSLADVGAALGKDAGIAALAPDTAAAVTSPVTSGAVTEAATPPATGGIEALTPELNVGTAAPPATTGGIEALTPEVNVGTAAPSVPEYAPEVNIGTAAPPVSEGIAALPAEPVSGMDLAADATKGNTIAEAGQGITALPAEPSLPTSVPSTPMEPANPQDFGATIENGGVAPNTVANPVGTGDPGSAPLDTTSNLPGENAGAPGSSYITTPGGGIADITGAGAAAAGAGAAGSGFFQSIADATGLPLGTVQTLAAGLGLKAATSLLSPDQTPGSTSVGGPGPAFQLGENYEPYKYKPFAAGGIADLGGYSDGGRLLRGPGDGVSDSIPAMIGGRQPARLADGEFVIPARIVSELGNGSTEAGARQLYAMMDRIQAARRKTVGKDKVAANTKAAKHLPA